MMKRSAHPGRAAAAVVVLAAGCAAPPSGPESPPSGLFGPAFAWETGPARQPLVTDWQPIVGRCAPELRRRHGLAESPAILVLNEEFEQATQTSVPGWQIVGYPSLRPVRLEGAAGLEIRAPADTREPCGLERGLPPGLLAGRDTRIDIRLTCRSFLRLQGLEKVRVFLEACDDAGRSSQVVLPLETGVSPGWEWQQFHVRFQPGLSTARIRILATEAGASLTVDAVRLTASDPLWTSAAAPTEGRAARLIDDGHFEAGSSRFFTSAATRWPNGDLRIVPLSWQYVSDPSGRGNCLTINLTQPAGRVGFGPIDLNGLGAARPGAERAVFLSFLARASRPGGVSASLRTRSRLLGRMAYTTAPQWQRFTGTFRFTASRFEEQLDLRAAELVFELAGDGSSEVNACGLDDVVLNAGAIEPSVPRPAVVDMGLWSPAKDTADLSNLFDVSEPVSFVIRLAREPAMPAGTRPADEAAASRGGRLAIDVLDAWDRTVVRQTRPVSLPASGIWTELFEIGVRPAGYYRVLATLWSGPPGESAMIARGSLAMTVISLRDPVPAQNLFGLATEDGNVSARTTQLGAGWVRIDLTSRQIQVSPGRWDFAPWQAILGQCQRARADVVADVDVPTGLEDQRSFLASWLKDEPFQPIGIVLRPPAIGLLSGRGYLVQVEQVRAILAASLPGMRVVEDLSYLEGLPDRQASAGGGPVPIVWGLSSRETPLPEDRESYVEAIGRRRPANTEVWELSAPARLGGVLPLGSGLILEPAGSAGGVVQLLRSPVDPVRSASRMVRAMLVRTLAGANMVCTAAAALTPPRSIYDEDQTCLHERDYSPRPALVAFDLATQLLNNATLERWIDLPGGGRVLFFEKDDGGAVAALWRPYGLTGRRVSFQGLPASLRVVDCLGTPVSPVTEGDRRVIEANEFVRYLVVPADGREALRHALDTILVEAAASPGDRPTSRPVR